MPKEMICLAHGVKIAGDFCDECGSELIKTDEPKDKGWPRKVSGSGLCPICGYALNHEHQKFCPGCGRALIWTCADA